LRLNGAGPATSGGTDQQGLLTAAVPADGSLVSAGLTDSKSTGDPGATCAGTKHSGLTVRAIHVVVTKGALGLLPGVDVVVAEAHSDATFGP
jgi:hypothetical protein